MIKMLFMDVDGTLTDGKIYIGLQGEIMKAFNVKDGMGITKLHNNNIIPVILTSRHSRIVDSRAKELNISEVHQGVKNKVEKLKQIISKYNFRVEEIAYIGDDENDLECMYLCNFSGCPVDSADAVKKVANFICKNKGGDGAVREFAEYLINLQTEKDS